MTGKEDPVNVMMLPRDILLGSMSESEQFDPDVLLWYSGFKTRWNRIAGSVFGGTGAVKPTDEETELFLRTLKDAMKREAPGWSYVGMGTEKVAFVTEDRRYCVKVSAPYDGYQNQIMDEVRISKALGGASCVYGIIDHDGKDYTSMLCECCCEATEDDWTERLGLPYSDVMAVTETFVDCGSVRPSRDEFMRKGSVRYLDRRFRYREQVEALGTFLKRWYSEKSPMMDSLRSFVQARIDTQGRKLRDCVRHLENWGVSKDGVLKVIDIGL